MSCWLPCWGTAHEGDPVSAAISSGPRLKAWLGPAVLLSLVLGLLLSAVAVGMLWGAIDRLTHALTEAANRQLTEKTK